ncbi:sterol desaturase family protein [Halieaceae bacterium IMCC14734]|uniref:Sterol desaturase family protein n=1 Tax=Candidatus Litorirhabdus singularis TaxID=2518993 RepID=A0ABT3TLD1_9GAMM|nr:sterol desaturase family protein [Candidatus Litorirhabdus singularis]MCX2982565.1 sterol desaturase family protein [Candidatus Litorirhabdus singularis]
MTADNPYFLYPALWWRRLISWTSYPLVMITVMGGMLWVMQHRPEATAAAFGVGLVSVPLCVWLLERVQPHCADWHPSWTENVRTDITTLVINSLLAAVVSEPLRLALFALLGGYLAAHMPWSLWPHSWPLLPQFCLALLIADLGSYWYHRKMHEWPWGWRLHAVHHSSNRLYWLNAPRFHYLDITFYGLSGTLPLVLLGASPECFLLVALFSASHGYFQHANYRVHLGPLNYIFSMAELHRWHHSKDVTLANHNYGNNTIVWDWVFGSFFWPRDRVQQSSDIGTGDVELPLTYWGLFLAPLRWPGSARETPEVD